MFVNLGFADCLLLYTTLKQWLLGASASLLMVSGVKHSPPCSILHKSVVSIVGVGGQMCEICQPGSCSRLGLSPLSLLAHQHALLSLPSAQSQACRPPTGSCICQGEEEVAVLLQVLMKNASL